MTLECEFAAMSVNDRLMMMVICCAISAGTNDGSNDDELILFV